MKTNIFYDRKLWERWHELEGMEINTLNKPPQWESDIVCLPMNSRQDAQKSSVTKKKLCIVSGFPCQHHPWSQKQYLSFCLFFFPLSIYMIVEVFCLFVCFLTGWNLPMPSAKAKHRGWRFLGFILEGVMQSYNLSGPLKASDAPHQRISTPTQKLSLAVWCGNHPCLPSLPWWNLPLSSINDWETVY